MAVRVLDEENTFQKGQSGNQGYNRTQDDS